MRALTVPAGLLTALLTALLLAIVPAHSFAQQTDAVESPVVRSDEEAVAEQVELPEDFDPGFWPTAAAVFPGVLFHGSGLWLAGADDAAYEVARVQAIGLVTTTLSLIGIYTTGASEDTIGLFAYPGLVGVSAFVMPWFADIYGSSVGGRTASARQALAPIEARAGYMYVHDPVFDYDHFTYAEAEVRLEPVRLVPKAWVSLDNDNQQLRFEGIGRLIGPRAGERATRPDGSFLDLEGAVTYHSFEEGFKSLVVESSLAGRYDLRRLSPVLQGSFYELSLGLGGQFFGYDAPDAELGEDLSALLLMETAFGVYFGPSADRYGEAKVYYDHRHDGFVRGLGLASQVDGVMGHVGAEGFYYLGDNWGAFADFKAGSTYTAMGGLTFRYGGN
jgi:hypothetical protein